MASTLKPDAAPFIPGPSLRGSASTFMPPSPLVPYPTQPFYNHTPVFHIAYPYVPSASTPFPYAHIEYTNPDYNLTGHPGAFAYQLSEIHAMMPRRGFSEQEYEVQSESAYHHGMNNNSNVTTRRRKKKKAFSRRDGIPDAAYPSSDDMRYANQDVEGVYYAPKPKSTKHSSSNKHNKRTNHRTKEGIVFTPAGAFLSEYTGAPKPETQNAKAKAQSKAQSKTKVQSKPKPKPKPNENPHKTTTSQAKTKTETAHPKASSASPHNKTNRHARVVEKEDGMMNQCAGEGDWGLGPREEEYFERKAWRSQREMKGERRGGRARGEGV